jgi:hypothetical protein
MESHQLGKGQQRIKQQKQCKQCKQSEQCKQHKQRKQHKWSEREKETIIERAGTGGAAGGLGVYGYSFLFISLGARVLRDLD